MKTREPFRFRNRVAKVCSVCHEEKQMFRRQKTCDECRGKERK